MDIKEIKGLLVDVGGVIMTNAWDRKLRHKVVETFGIEQDEFDERHRLFNDLLELGKIGFMEYLDHVVFYKERSFSPKKVFEYIKEAVTPYPDMIDYLRGLKQQYGLKIGVLSNESRDLAIDRFQRIPLHDFVDYFLVSAFVGMRKPDPGIYELALDLLQLKAHEVAYLDDRKPYAEFARGLNIRAIHHTSLDSTQNQLGTHAPL